MEYAIINSDNLEVINIIIWDGQTELGLPTGFIVVVANNEHKIAWNNKQLEKLQSEQQE
jgi:hypothetical protein